MKKFTVNKIILAIAVLISLFLFIKFLPTLETFNSVWVFLFDIFIFIFIIPMPLLLGFILASPFIFFAKKINSEKILRYIFYISFLLVLFFFAYHLFSYYNYENEIKTFEFEQRLRRFAYDIPNPLVRFFLQTLQSLFEANIQFINLMTGFMINIYRKLEK
jgi:hypothetical protein